MEYDLNSLIDTLDTINPTKEIRHYEGYTTEEYHTQIRKDLEYLRWDVEVYRKQTSVDPYILLYWSKICPAGKDVNPNDYC